MVRAYAGIGARTSPSPVVDLMERVAARLAALGWMLRSGGSGNADRAFERGCLRANGAKQIFLPWAGFDGRTDGIVLGDCGEAREIARKFHPAWQHLGDAAKKLHTRNVGQVLGPRIDPSDASAFVIAWTVDGKAGGGTGEAIRIAHGYGVPVVDLALPGALERITELVRR